MMRSAGMTLSPFNAWVVLKGLETLSIRMQAQSARALELARWLEAQPHVERVYYPGLNRIRSTRSRWRSSRAAAARWCRSIVQGRAAPQAARANAFHVIDSTRDLLDHRQPRRHQDHRSRIRRAPRTAA